ncbi:rabgap/tbc domain-containing protein [Anaeramoeba flamelloides]|uniref:Rabgap/tbc domain-containing protein n=1 Tax=Anaeramoeba flamelloides TaxID=1746091 RepID=A0AAV7YAH1_9EUKA|nr:rabgap/tbc domain-containing protein [Anaeramoeba flamelloides]
MEEIKILFQRSNVYIQQSLETKMFGILYIKEYIGTKSIVINWEPIELSHQLFVPEILPFDHSDFNTQFGTSQKQPKEEKTQNENKETLETIDEEEKKRKKKKKTKTKNNKQNNKHLKTKNELKESWEIIKDNTTPPPILFSKKETSSQNQIFNEYGFKMSVEDVSSIKLLRNKIRKSYLIITNTNSKLKDINIGWTVVGSGNTEKVAQKKSSSEIDFSDLENEFHQIQTFNEEEQEKFLQYFSEIPKKIQNMIPQEDLPSTALDQKLLDSLMDKKGRIMDMNKFCAIIFYNGIDPKIRPQVWKILIGLYPQDSDLDQKNLLFQQYQKKYQILKNQWQTFTEEQINNFKKWRKIVFQVDKDIIRSDRDIEIFSDLNSEAIKRLKIILLSYSIYNFDTGYSYYFLYCQGMADYATPLIYLFDNETEIFWLFKKLMDKYVGNFNKDQQTIQKKITMLKLITRKLDPGLYYSMEDDNNESDNFLFSYRMMIVLFKREFQFHDILPIWDSLFTNYLSDTMEIFFIYSIMHICRKRLIQSNRDFSYIVGTITKKIKKIHYKKIIKISIETIFKIAKLMKIEKNITKKMKNKTSKISNSNQKN